VLSVHSRSGDADAARAWLDGLLERSRRDNPFRGRALEAVVAGCTGLRFRVLDLDAVGRADVVLPAAVWDEVDRNVHGLFAARARLAAAGLAENRGLLLAGPPGTGKTLLTRVLAAELPAGVTVVFCDGKAVAGTVRQLYAELEHLAPALVVMEDIDLVVADRHRGSMSTGPLVDFLLALDGAVSRHRGVVTVATTNDPAAIDAAAKRAARFDRLVEVPPPDAVGRAAILTRYLRSLPGSADIDVARVAAATDGATGADLRELVTLAVLHTSRHCAADEGAVTTDLLLRLAAEAGYQLPIGQYL
jgi:ATP-dependent 26S proteasome regulatory subunit